MKPTATIAAALLGSLLLSPHAAAQAAPRLGAVRIGLPSGAEGGRTRNGAWAPVYVTLQAGPQDVPANLYSLVLETTDQEDVPYRFAVPVPGIAANAEPVVLGYTLPASDGQDFTVRLEAGGKAVATLPKQNRSLGEDGAVAPGHVLFLAVGPGLGQLRRAADKGEPAPNKDPDPARARRQFAVLEDVSLLPDRWFGYDAADVVVLGTGDARLVAGLLEAPEARRTALLEWVRRGGQLVLSAGRNAADVDKLLQEKLPLIDCRLKGPAGKTGLTLRELSFGFCRREGHLGALDKVELAQLTPGPGVQVLVREGDRPVLAQAAFGMGRVIVTAFDLDSPPFTTWSGSPDFWRRLQEELAPALAAQARPGKDVPEVAFGNARNSRDMEDELKRGLETFDDIPAISFGWVALFLLFYIALVGPLDYLILKKLVKRLELTWVTFPVTVLVVSVAAYFTAYLLKGDDLRVNKIDLVDIQLHPGAQQGGSQVVGTTWFSLFSPRVQSYTVGLEPVSPTWTAPPPEGTPGTELTLLEGQDRGLRTGSQGLFPRAYEYAADATGVRRVPIPVWAARSFVGSWRAGVPAETPPVLVRGVQDRTGLLNLNAESGALVGSITNQLGVELQGATLFYEGKWYALGTLVPGQTVAVNALFARDARGQGRAPAQWFTENALAPELALAPGGKPADALSLIQRSGYQVIKRALFHHLGDDSTWNNAGLRHLDQSWRARPAPVYPRPAKEAYRAEAILVARTPIVNDRGESAALHPASPTRVWLGALPGERAERPALAGQLTQETFLRVFIPVQPTR